MGLRVPSDVMVTNWFGFRHYLRIVFCVLIVIECIISLELSELRVPTHVALGSRAHLLCRWELGPADALYSVKWYKDGKEFFRHIPRDSEPRRRFALPGVNVEKSDSSGSTLVLSAVMFETAGRYRCEVSGERPLFPTVSDYADMAIVDLPERGPVITGLRTRYHCGDRVQANCTSGPSWPACQLLWYVNGEPVPTAPVLPRIHQGYGGKLEMTTLLLDFVLTDKHFRKNEVKVKCLATLATLYWQSKEASALLEKENMHKKMLLTVQTTSPKVRSAHINVARFLTSSSTMIINTLLVTMFCMHL